jgi:thiamine-monophosphate kinase
MSREFDWIARYFRPLAESSPVGLGLIDDAALLTPPPGSSLVLTADAMVAGVHFLADDPPGLIARKLLRVNLSDLAAMGARALGYLITVSWPETIEEPWIGAFAAGLEADQTTFDVVLFGGDTTRTPGPLCLSLTAIGSVPEGRALRRNGAGEGDEIWVSGTLGDAGLALREIGDRLPDSLCGADRDALRERLRLPTPRLALGQALLREDLATAAIDISDGLVADLGHVAETSGLAAEVDAARVPLSGPARRALDADPGLLAEVLTGGDDYELLFTAPSGRAEALGGLAERLDLPLTSIGRMAAGQGVAVRDASGTPLALEHTGWSHF